MFEWNVSQSELPPEIGMLGAPALKWNSGALGQPTFTECFDKDPNFTPCWQGVFRLAQQQCPQGPNYNTCVDTEARRLANQSCIPACEAYLRGGEAYPWGVRSDDTCGVQDEVNSALTDPDFVGGSKTAGTTYRPIARDCKMGPATCGALAFLGEGTPSSCQGHPWTTPTKTGLPGPVTPVPPVVSSGKKSSGGAGLALLGFSALAAIGAALVSAGR